MCFFLEKFLFFSSYVQHPVCPTVSMLGLWELWGTQDSLVQSLPGLSIATPSHPSYLMYVVSPAT